MPNSKISALTSATTPLAGTEVVPLVQSGTTKKVSVSDLTAGRSMSALVASFGSGTSAYAIGGTQVSLTNSSANTYLSVYGGAGATNGGFLLGGNNAENQANVFWSNSGNYLQIAANPVGSKISLSVAGVAVGNITTNGFAPAAGKGIDFSANGGDVLNQYDEGTWTVRLYDDNNAGNQSSTTATGYYTRIGNQVTITFAISNISTAGMTGANPLWFSLPFTPNSTYGGASGACSLEQVTFPANMTYISPLILAGTARGVFRGSGSAANTSSVLVQNISSGVSDVERCTVTYFI